MHAEFACIMVSIVRTCQCEPQILSDYKNVEAAACCCQQKGVFKIIHVLAPENNTSRVSGTFPTSGT